jgi:general secretion pathway protein D
VREFLTVKAREALLAAVVATAVVACAAPSVVLAAAAPTASKAESYSFAFQDADITQVTDEILGSTLGLSFTIDPGVTGKMSFRLDRRLTKAQLLEAFEAALAANNIALVRDGENLIVTPREKARGSAGLRPLSDGVGRAGYEVVAVPLSYAVPSEVAKAFEAMGAGTIVVYQNDKLGLLMLGGNGKEIQSALETVKVFDRSGLEGSKIRWFELRQAPAQTVAQELDKVLQLSGTTGVSLVALKRLNGLFVFGRTPTALDEVGRWVEKLDVPSKEESTALWIYRPKNLSADSMAQTLNSVLSTQSTVGRTQSATTDTPSGTPAVDTTSAQTFTTTGDDTVRVGVDKQSNTLLVSAPATRWMQIEKILTQIDVTPRQILIDASIIEATLTNEFRFGIDWSVLTADGKLRITSSSDKGGIIGPAFPGIAVTFLGDDIKAAINALGSRTAVEVISAPKIIALDNRTAKLQVGDQVPITTQSARSASTTEAPLVVSTEYRNTGVILNVTPRISGDDKILLEVSQEVSSVAQTTSSGIDSPTIQQRKMESTLIIRDGGTVALGGLISSSKTRGNSGVPGLRNVPLIGHLFRRDVKDNRRTELIVLLTAKIINVDDASNHVMADLLEDMRELKSRGLVKP